jgi:hypothetical protein
VASVVPNGGGVTPARRYPRWQDAVGATIAGLWPVALTLSVLRNPGRYNPYALYSGLGQESTHSVATLPTTDPGIYTTQYTLGVRAATQLVHLHVPWWNPFEALGTPLIGEGESGGLFPLTPLLLLHDGSLVFHLALAAIAGVATFFLLRELRCSPVIAAVGGMLFATNGTYAWLANAVASPVCFLPLLLLGVERARRHAADARGGGWRWLAVGTALALLAGFVEVAALGLILAAVVAVQRGWTLPRERAVAYARKVLGALACGIAVAAPALVAFQSYLSNGYVAQHAGNTADHGLSATYVPVLVAPYLFGRIHANPFPSVHLLWGAVGGYAGFALLALAVASLFGRRERGLRITLAAWVGLALADSVGLPGLKNLVALTPVVQHVVLYRYLAPTWELALVILAAFALRDLATSPRATSVVAITSGVLTTAVVLLAGMALAPNAVRASRSLASGAMHQAELLVLGVVAALLLALLLPRRYRGLAIGAIAVAEAAVLFAIPLTAWPTSNPVDTAAVTYLTTHADGARIYAVGVPTANFGSQVGVRQLNVVDLPIPTSLVPVLRSIDPDEPPSRFTGTRPPDAGVPTPEQELLVHLGTVEALGVRYVVLQAGDDAFAHRGVATLAYEDAKVQIWRLDDASPLASAHGCGLRVLADDAYLATCPRRTLLVRTVSWFPGWSATVNGRSVPVFRHGAVQAVVLPKGRSIVALTFLPPDVPLATVVCVLALLALFVPYDEVAQWRRERRRRGQWSDVYEDDRDAAAPSRGATGAPGSGAVGAWVEGDDEPSTSAVPQVTGSVAVVTKDAGDGGGPPTTAVAVDTGERPRPDDPPTLAVPTSRPREDGGVAGARPPAD